MGLLHPIKTKKYRKFLKSEGWKFDRIRGDHEIWVNDQNEELVFISNDKEILPFIIRQNNKILGISDKEFLQRIRKI